MNKLLIYCCFIGTNIFTNNLFSQSNEIASTFLSKELCSSFKCPEKDFVYSYCFNNSHSKKAIRVTYSAFFLNPLGGDYIQDTRTLILQPLECQTIPGLDNNTKNFVTLETFFL